MSISDLNRKELQSLLDFSIDLKSQAKKEHLTHHLQSKVIGLLFEKPSTRTRVGFETSIYQLGGQAIYLRADELQLARGEPIKDTARILGSYLNGIVMRTYDHHNLVEFAEYAPVPIINALSDLEHPTQIVTDMMTIQEVGGKLTTKKFAWVGDGNNVCNSWILGGAIMGMQMVVSCPSGCDPKGEVIRKAKLFAGASNATIQLVRDPYKAVEEADVIYTDVWVSMGQEKCPKKKETSFKKYQVNKKLVSLAKPDCVVMHCLPAHRGMEITDDVLEGENSIIWQQAENKLHAARGVLAAFLGAAP